MKPNCYKCKYRGEIPGDAHSNCSNRNAKVEGDNYGKQAGWFLWPFNFDPVWLISCNGFRNKECEYCKLSKDRHAMVTGAIADPVCPKCGRKVREDIS